MAKGKLKKYRKNSRNYKNIETGARRKIGKRIREKFKSRPHPLLLQLRLGKMPIRTSTLAFGLLGNHLRSSPSVNTLPALAGRQL
jgi:hypothetical protein